MDFNDVFGGPPRRYSMQQDRMGNSFSGTEGSEKEGFSNPWRSPKEKPVFGDDSLSTRSQFGGDFYDDIFGGNETFTSPRSNYERHSSMGRSPSSKFISPSRLSPLIPESLDGHSPPIISLPRKMITAKDLFYRNTGLSSPGLLRATSRFSDKYQEEIVMDDETPSYEASVRYQYWSSLVTPDGKDGSGNLNKESGNAEYDVEDRFHFSIYKWAGKGVPMLIPVLGAREKGGTLAARKSDMSPASLSRRFQDFYQELFDKVHDIDEMVNPHRLNDIQVRNRKGIQGGVKKTRGMSTPANESLYDADDARKMEGAEGMSARDEANNVKVDKGRDKGKVREVVEMMGSRNKSDSPRSRNRASPEAPKEMGKFSSHYVHHTPDHSFEREEEEYHHPPNAQTYTSDHFYPTAKNPSPLGIPRQGSNTSLENDDDITEFNFVVEVLSDDPENAAETEGFDPKAADAKIEQWSAGKKGNIRSLLSTLQFVLWPESGWNPVPLVDLLEANSVKRAYQKALLQLHPDKLQQKNAATHQKYIAEKVFDILQEAWDHFNNLAPP